VVIVTSDNGMPFPRAKSQEYQDSNHLPLAIMWPAGIRKTGRVVDDYLSFIDFAPTVLDLAGVPWGKSGMASLTGRSFTNLLASEKAGRIDPARDHVLIGKERHDVGRPDDEGYPIRGIVKNDMLYLQNFEPARWPAGDPETGYLTCDGSPTKTQILKAHRRNPADTNWALCFGKHPAAELFDLKKDPDCMANLAGAPATRELEAALQTQLTAELKAQEDPRMAGNGAMFEKYPYSDEAFRNFYNRFKAGEKLVPFWANAADFEKAAPADTPVSP
jgi:arylsulfatase A-like enzyme